MRPRWVAGDNREASLLWVFLIKGVGWYTSELLQSLLNLTKVHTERFLGMCDPLCQVKLGKVMESNQNILLKWKHSFNIQCLKHDEAGVHRCSRFVQS